MCCHAFAFRGRVLDARGVRVGRYHASWLAMGARAGGVNVRSVQHGSRVSAVRLGGRKRAAPRSGGSCMPACRRPLLSRLLAAAAGPVAAQVEPALLDLRRRWPPYRGVRPTAIHIRNRVRARVPHVPASSGCGGSGGMSGAVVWCSCVAQHRLAGSSRQTAEQLRLRERAAHPSPLHSRQVERMRWRCREV